MKSRTAPDWSSTGPEQDLDALQIPDRRLRVDVEFAQRFHIISEKLGANRTLGLPGKQIEDPAANGELSAGGDLRRAFVTRGDERFDHPFHRLLFAATQRQDRGIQDRRSGRRLIKRRARGNDHVRAFFALSPVQESEPFRRDIRIGQNIFHGGEFRFRQKERAGQPIEQTLVKQFLRSNIRTQDPECFPNFSGNRGDEKRLGRFGHVGEGDGTRALLDLAQFLRDRLCAGDDSGAGDCSENLTGNVSPDRSELQT